MSKAPELRKELATERRELKAAVTDLRDEIGRAVELGKKVSAGVGAATGAAVVAKVLFRVLRDR